MWWAVQAIHKETAKTAAILLDSPADTTYITYVSKLNNS